MDLIKKVSLYADHHELFTPAMKVVVAVSGGPDSVALLHILLNLRHRWGFQIFVAHFNHGLRAEAKKEQEFLSNLCTQLAVPLFIGKGKILKGRGSLEEKARHARFQFLISIAKKRKADAIVLGHTQDDLAETVLMRILRGTGLLGLRSILPKRLIGQTFFLRPLLCSTKNEILAFLKKHHFTYQVDPSNFSIDFFRNKIRLELFPFLEKSYSPKIKELLAGLAQTASMDYDYLYREGEKAFQRLKIRSSKDKKNIKLQLSGLAQLPCSLRRIVLRLALEKVQGHLRRFTLDHIEEMERLIKSPCSRSTMSLPQKIQVSKKQSYLMIQEKI